MKLTTVYKYGMRLRGFSPGCQPRDGLLGREDDTNGKYYDVIAYDRKLTDKEVSDYELDYLGEMKGDNNEKGRVLRKHR